MNNKIIYDQYIMYGLNHRRSFVRLPKCEDCDEMMGVYLSSHEEMNEFAIETLTSHDCISCALFFAMQDGTYRAYFKGILDEIEDPEEVEIGVCEVNSDDSHLFADVDADARLCCYSLFIEHENGRFEVCV